MPEGQQLSFRVTPLDPTSILDAAFPAPMIDAATGTFAACLAPNTHGEAVHPTPLTLHPTPYTLHPAPYTLHTTPYTLHLTL